MIWRLATMSSFTNTKIQHVHNISSLKLATKHKTSSTWRPQTSSEAADPAKFVELSLSHNGTMAKVPGFGSPPKSNDLLLMWRPTPQKISNITATSFSLQVNKCNNASFHKTALVHILHSGAMMQLRSGDRFYSRLRM